MKPIRPFLAALLAAIFLPGCVTDWHKNAALAPPGREITGRDWYGDEARKVVWLNQGWTPGESNWFYNTTQGSQLMPYAFFLALEQAENSEPFRSVRNLQKFRFLPENPNPLNHDGLPVGFVPDEGSTLPAGLIADRRSIGLTCAACHTAQINYHGTAMRIDGGPTMADFEGFLAALTKALVTTSKDNAKFERFAANVIGNSSAEKKAQLKTALAETVRRRSAYESLNQTSVPYGFARLDAFGRIFNNALTLVDPHNRVTPNASVSYPHIWDAPREDFVQWTRITPNAGKGSLGRNVGEVIGVFATIDSGHPPPSLGYRSSVRLQNLIALEDKLRQLQSPVWPEKILPPIDTAKANAGRKLFVNYCQDCHHDVVRDDPDRHLITVGTPISDLKTDALTAENIRNGRGKTGFLKDTWTYVIAGTRIPAEDSAFHIVGNTVLRTIVGQVKVFDAIDEPRHLVRLQGGGLNTTTDAAAIMQRAGGEPQLQYKARPLNGIWATAPYLHNGSVPNLFELLLPASARGKKFYVGRREFDPVKVGFVSEKVEGAFPFDTSVKGNSNAGHEYGTKLSETERWQLLEYLKKI